MNTDGWLSDLIQMVLPILEKVIMVVGNIFTQVIYNLLVRFMLTLFSILDGLTDVIKVLGGAKSITYDQKVQSIYSVFMGDTLFKKAFWGIFLFSCLLGFFFCIISVIRDMVSEERDSIMATLRLMMKTFLTFLLIPLILTGAAKGSVVFAGVMNDMMELSGGGQLSTGKSLFLTASMGMERGVTGEEAYSFEDKWRYPYYSGKYDYTDSQRVLKSFHFDLPRIFLSTAVALIILFLLAICIMTYMKRLMDIMLLYMLSPYFICMIPLDREERYNKWRDMIFARLCSGFSLLMMLDVVNFLVLPAIQSKIVFSPVWLTNVVLRLVFTAAGIYGAYKSHILLVRIMNPMAAEEEEHVGKKIGDVVMFEFQKFRQKKKEEEASKQ